MDRKGLALIALTVVASVVGIVSLVLWLRDDPPHPGAEPSSEEVAEISQSWESWCADREWLRQAAFLLRWTYPNGGITAERVNIEMEYGGALRMKYQMFVQRGRLPAGLEGPDGRLAQWAIFLANSGPPHEFDEIAAEVIARCS